ncbi:uncharacterized protein LOC105836713 isoform X1 [Monomorium pharaonis]|uniref:uncharacterized protein LOC105836713 isoform X1 n=2 Tax=Monomorium pharaonis TaxID=307658 RepID=UPI001745C56C|nr:uncharacterized protein LOC105836713 isoform X1 [Monomorium pharaonis]
MMGEHNLVASRFKEQCPGIVIMKCICHSLHLCASEACKKLPHTCEDLARNIHNFFKNSSKRMSEYQEFQQFCNIEIHKLLHPSQTRWLSLLAVVNRIIEQWPALILFFNEKWLQEKLISAEQVFKALNNPFIQLYYYFLQWILPKIIYMNELFQSEKVLVAHMHQKMVETYTDLLLCFMKRNYVLSKPITEIDPTDSSKFLEKPNLYLGIKVMNAISNKEIQNRKDMLVIFYENVLNFMKTLCMEIKKRYNFDDKYMSMLKIFTPKVAISNNARDQYPTLLPLLNHFSRFTEKDKFQEIDDEWRNLPLLQLSDNILEVEIDVFWVHILKLNVANSLSKFVLNILSLPHSNAQCERIFSKINLIKTKTRNKLNISTINGTLLASQNVKKNTLGSCSCINFTPSKNMLSKFSQKMYDFNRDDDNEVIFEDCT